MLKYVNHSFSARIAILTGVALSLGVALAIPYFFKPRWEYSPVSQSRQLYTCREKRVIAEEAYCFGGHLVSIDLLSNDYTGWAVDPFVRSVECPELPQHLARIAFQQFPAGGLLESHSYGWPHHCLEGSMWLADDDSRAYKNAVQVGVEHERHLLVFKPVWIGLCLNTAAFGSMVYALLVFCSACRTALRRRWNRCPQCGYSRAGLQQKACPECGCSDLSHIR